MLVRTAGSVLLALSLLSCGGDDSTGVPAPRAVPLWMAESPDVAPAPTSSVAAPTIFPNTPIYDFQSGVLDPTTSSPAAEEHVAISPLNSCIWMAAISDFSIRGGFNTTKYTITYDFATSWHEAFVPNSGTGNGGKVLTGDGQSFDANSDPVVAFDRSGNVYVANLYFDGQKVGARNGIYVAVAPVGSQASPLNFAQSDVHVVVAHLSHPASITEDKEWIAVDNSVVNGRVYLTWTRFDSADRIMFSSSSDQGVTWTTPKQISAASQDGAVQGSMVAVGPDGTVYVVYDADLGSGSHRHSFTKSTDHGATWTTPVTITPAFLGLDTPTGFSSTYRKDSFPYLAVNPTAVSGQAYGEIYVVYPDQLPSPATNSDIKFIRSADNGATFSAPIALNDVSTGQRLMPSITADDHNNIHISWFDTRQGADAQTYDIYAARGSISSGVLTWGSVNVRVTPSSMTTSQSFIGDYAGIASSSLNDGGVVWGFAVPVWTGSGGTRILKAALLAYNP